jgi:hypothetical protein
MPDQNAAQTGFDPNAGYASAPQNLPQDATHFYDPDTKQIHAAPQAQFDPNAAYEPAPGSDTTANQPKDTGIASRAWQAAKDEAGNIVQGVVAPIKTAFAPPQSAREHALLAIGGPNALAAYRASQGVVGAAENVFKAKQENFRQAAIDLSNAVNEFHQKDYRRGTADTASAVAGAMGIGGDPVPEMGRVRDILQGTKPGGDIVTPVTKDVVDLGAALATEKAPEIVKGTGKAAEAVADTAKAAPGKIISGAKNTAEAIKPEWLTKRAETAPAQHGTPSRVEAPLDGPTVGKQLGGKDLSAEALNTLQQHVGETIPAGSTAKNMLTKAVEPVVKTINETASKMNKTVADAHPFTTSVLQDNVFGEGGLTNQIDEIKKNLPPSVRDGLTADIDAVMEDADDALNSMDPSAVLEARRKLGNKIDWDDIVRNPTTPAEVQNAARVKVYRALGEKIHAEIPETVELDKTLQPNLELRSHMVRKLGERVVDDPLAATTEHQTELKKGQTTVENAAHNEQVLKNWSKVKYALIGLGVGTGLIHQIENFLK